MVPGPDPGADPRRLAGQLAGEVLAPADRVPVQDPIPAAGPLPHPSPVGEDFGAACDQIDRADTLLAAAHTRARHRHPVHQQAWPETDGPAITALARHDPGTGTVTLVLDATAASIAMFAVAAHASEREAHAREVERSGADWPEGSYGRRNRQAIAARETRVATRLRAIQHAYQAVAGHDTAHTPSEPARAVHPPGHAADMRSNSSRAPRRGPYREDRPQTGPARLAMSALAVPRSGAIVHIVGSGRWLASVPAAGNRAGLMVCGKIAP